MSEGGPEAREEAATAVAARPAPPIGTKPLKIDPQQAVVIDGRTFLRPGQLRPLLELAASLDQSLRVIECVCDDAVAKGRLERDAARGSHPTDNRDFALYLSLKTVAGPIALPHLVLDTGRLSPGECVQRCLDFFQGS